MDWHCPFLTNSIFQSTQDITSGHTYLSINQHLNKITEHATLTNLIRRF